MKNAPNLELSLLARQWGATAVPFGELSTEAWLEVPQNQRALTLLDQPKTTSPSSSVSLSAASLPFTSSCGSCPISSCSWRSVVPGTYIRNTSGTIDATGTDP